MLRTACNKARLEADNQIESLFSHLEKTIIVKLHLIVITAVERSNDKADEGKRHALDILPFSVLKAWEDGGTIF